MIIYTPYTYLIGWTNHNKWYYGVRFAKNCHPSDLWNTYFTSSKIVKKYRELYGEPDIVQIRKTFSDRNAAIIWEEKVLKRMNVIYNDIWLNKTSNRSFSDDVRFSMLGKKHSEKTISTLRERKIGENNPMYGKEVCENHRIKISKGNKGKKRTEDQKKKYSIALSGSNNGMYGKKHPNHKCTKGSNNGMYGKKHNQDTKEKMRQAQKNKMWITDGTSNRKVNKDIEMPSGWFRGRTI